MTKRLSSTPQSDHLYRFRKGDRLLTVTGQAYALGSGSKRLHHAQMVNRHPFNWRLHSASRSNFNRKYFPEGIISLRPRFSCDNSDFDKPFEFPAKGRCYPIAFIPPDSDVWHRPPIEVVQPDARTCWAAAIFSLTKVTPRTKRFRSVDDVVSHFRKLRVDIPTASGKVTKGFVTTTGGLVRLPKTNLSFATSGGTIMVPAGRITVETVAQELKLDFEAKDSSLTLDDVVDILQRSTGPVMVFKYRGGKIGHASVIFGVSKTDQFIGEMDPFPMASRPTGPALGPKQTRWLPTFKSFAEQKRGKLWDEFIFFFKSK